jgi:subtilase family serine protease
MGWREGAVCAAQSKAQAEEAVAQSATASHVAGAQRLHGHRSAAMAKAPLVGRLEPATKMHLAIGLPLRNQAALNTLISQIYDPKSPQHRHYLTVAQFAETYGPTAEDYGAVVKFAGSKGFVVNTTFASRMVVSITGTSEKVEKAFHVRMNKYKRADGTIFHAPDREPSLDLSVPVLHIGGLDDFAPPKSPHKVKPLDAATTRKLLGSTAATKTQDVKVSWTSAVTPKKGAASPPTPPNQGSAPGGGFGGNDFKNAYAPGVTLNGAGQCVALAEFGGYYEADLQKYTTLFGTPVVPVHAVLVGGFDGSPNPENEVEVVLDIDMAMTMAQKLNSVEVVEGPEKDSVFAAMASPPADSPLCYQASSSYLPGADDVVAQALAEMAVQGQSFFQAAGDSGAYQSDPGGILSANYVTLVGGTQLVMTGFDTSWSWQSETGWPNGGGGIESDHSIPYFQTSINMTGNGGSTKYRNAPDVSMDATNVFEIWNNGLNAGDGAGTSAAAPLWAGFMALSNQQAAINKLGPVGFANPAFYAIGSDPVMYAKDFHDIQSGTNNRGNGGITLPISFTAVPGYDLVTGWGTPQANLINDLSPIPAAPPTLYTLIEFDIKTGNDGLAASSAATATLVDPNGNPFQTATLKAEGTPAWEPNTRHVVNATLVAPLPATSFAHIIVTLAANDTWDINSMNVWIATTGQAACLVDLTGTPLVRLTANQVQTFTPRSGCEP